MTDSARKKVIQHQQQQTRAQLKERKLMMARNKAIKEATALQRRLRIEQQTAEAQAKLRNLQAREAARKRAKLDGQIRKVTKAGRKGVAGVFNAIRKLQNSDYAKRFRDNY